MNRYDVISLAPITLCIFALGLIMTACIADGNYMHRYAQRCIELGGRPEFVRSMSFCWTIDGRSIKVDINR